MRRLSMLVCALLMAVAAVANPVSQNQARKIALQFLQQNKPGVALQNKAVNNARRAGGAKPAFYAFNAQDGQGFVLVSGETGMPQVLGYGLSQGWPSDEEQLAPALRAMLEGYARYVADVRAGLAEPLNAIKAELDAEDNRASEPLDVNPDDLPQTAGPLLTTNWTQEYPYNMYVRPYPHNPADMANSTHDHNVIGCGAVALGQILHYQAMRHLEDSVFQHPLRRTTTTTYVTSPTDTVKKRDTVTLDPRTFYNQAQIPDTISYSPEKSKMDSATWVAKGQLIGKFLFDVACAMNMDWQSAGGSSGMTVCGQAAQLGFGASHDVKSVQTVGMCQLARARNLFVIEKELARGNPIFIGATDSQGHGGHAFVCDGYDQRDFLHINFGWANAGNSNNYFDPSIMNAYGYSGRPELVDYEKYNGPTFYVYNIYPARPGEEVEFDESHFEIEQNSTGLHFMRNGVETPMKYTTSDANFPPAIYADKQETQVLDYLDCNSYDRPFGHLNYELVSRIHSLPNGAVVSKDSVFVSEFDSMSVASDVERRWYIDSLLKNPGQYAVSYSAREMKATRDTIGPWHNYAPSSYVQVTNADYILNPTVYAYYHHAPNSLRISKEGLHILAHMDYYGNPDSLCAGDSLVTVTDFHFYLDSLKVDSTANNGVYMMLMHNDTVQEVLLAEQYLNLSSLKQSLTTGASPGFSYARTAHFPEAGDYKIIITCQGLPFTLVNTLHVGEATGLNEVQESVAKSQDKYIQDGQLFIEKNGVKYDASGKTVRY